MADDLFSVVASGAVKIRIDQRYPLAEAAQAHRDLEARKTTGSTRAAALRRRAFTSMALAILRCAHWRRAYRGAGACCSGPSRPSRSAHPDAPRPIDTPPWFAQSFSRPARRAGHREAGEQAADAVLRPGRLPVLPALDGGELQPEGHRRQDARALPPIAFNIWGDLEVTRIDGRRMTEKQFGRQLDVQFTPTLLFLDEQGRVSTRLNGYWPPHRFAAALDYVAEPARWEVPFADYLAQHGTGGGARATQRAAVPDEAAARSARAKAPSRSRCCSRRAIAAPATRCTPRAFSATRCARCWPASTWRASRSATARADTARRAQHHRARVGARAQRALHAHRGVLRRRQPRGVSLRRLCASVPPDGRVRLRRAGRVPHAAGVSAFLAGQGRPGCAPAASRSTCGADAVELAAGCAVSCTLQSTARR